MIFVVLKENQGGKVVTFSFYNIEEAEGYLNRNKDKIEVYSSFSGERLAVKTEAVTVTTLVKNRR